jgi:ferric-dicitrate binding protein FerR (iron transport regulator)
MNKEIILKYLAGNLKNPEKDRLFNWIKEDKENEILFSKLKNRNALISHHIKNQAIIEPDINKEFQLFQYKTEKSNKIPNISTVWKIKSYWWIAASLLLFLYGLAASYSLITAKQTVEYHSISTQKGEKSKLTLSDGTIIWLNSESKVEYPADIKRKHVEILLDGEAYFDVAENTKRNFIVKTSSIDIAVTGTRFNVKSYNNENTVEATLEKGEIIITGNIGNKKINQPVILKPNEQARLIKNRKQIEITNNNEKNIRTIDTTPISERNILDEKNEIHPELRIHENVTAELYTSWKDGKLMFKSESFKELALEMERWFDVEITILNKELEEKKFTGVFEKETIEQALEALSLSMHFKYQIDHNKITIFK